MIQTSHPLSGIRFLIIEDEMMQALLLGDMLTDMGGIVSDTVFGYDEARGAVYKSAVDCVVLDINLSGQLSFPIAEMLKARGTPFVFCTGYTDAVDAYPEASAISCVEKPVRAEDLRDAVLSALEAPN
jgi:DNA-binding NtrC family response regulator